MELALHPFFRGQSTLILSLISFIGLIVFVGCDASAGKRVRLTPTPGLPEIEVVFTGLDNPRGVVFGPNGEIFVTEAGTGYDSVDPVKNTGKLTKFTDHNADGDFDDEGEAEQWFSHWPTYNALQLFKTGRDEVSGPGDLLLHNDERLFISLDGGFDEQNLLEISPEGRVGRNLAGRANMNGIVFGPNQESIYIVESTANRLAEVTLAGEIRDILNFPLLASGQQAVPAGLAVDPNTGEILVALFSGTAVDQKSQEVIPLVPGDAKIVRVNPETGQLTDEITGLTTAIDVALDEAGNIFVVEFTTDHADTLPKLFDQFEPDLPPLHGGYLRYRGSVTLYPATGDPPRVLAEGLDEPTNVTIGPDGVLYVSTGQGTPGRPIPGPNGPTQIVGQIIRITYETSANDEQ